MSLFWCNNNKKYFIIKKKMCPTFPIMDSEVHGVIQATKDLLKHCHNI